MKLLTDYMTLTPSISKKLCKELLKELKQSKWREHDFLHYSGKRDYETQKNPCQTFAGQLPHSKELMEVLHKTIYNYIETIHLPYYDGWNGYTKTKFNKYQVGSLMEKHWDNIHSIFDGDIKGIPTLSIIGGLNNNFQGGEIEMFENTKIKLKVGEVLIFPSNFLYPHKVCPVTKGTRYSFVNWVY